MTVVVRCGSTDVHMALEDMLLPDQYDPAAFIRRTVEQMADGETYVLVFHPGYLDAFILGNSSLTVNRTKEVDALIDLELRLTPLWRARRDTGVAMGADSSADNRRASRR